MDNSDSTYLSFAFDGSQSLRDELRRPLIAITVTLDRIRIPLHAVLWMQDGSGIAIWSEMHDLAERVEVGVLRFATTTRHEEKAPGEFWGTAETFSLEGFNGEHSISKLLIEESGYECESGVVLTPASGGELVLVADAFPCHIAALGLGGLRSSSRPEYNLAHYKRIQW